MRLAAGPHDGVTFECSQREATHAHSPYCTDSGLACATMFPFARANPNASLAANGVHRSLEPLPSAGCSYGKGEVVIYVLTVSRSWRPTC